VSGDRVVLHVGAMKSGTSFLQSLMYANKDLLLERGVLLPGPRWAYQVRAVRSLFNGDGQLWEGLVDEVVRHEGTSVVSMEFLGPLRPPLVRRVVESFPDADVRVVITARDLNRSIAAMWQETVQNGRTWEWDEYVAAVTASRPGHRPREETQAGRTFWRQQHIVRIARTWAEVAGPKRVSLVTVPQPGAPRDLLWERFASVVGTDPAGLEPARAANESIGAASTLALRRLNELLDAEGLTFDDGARLRKGMLAKRVLAARKKQEPTIGLQVADWVEVQSRRSRTSLKRLGVQVVGDLDELTPVEVPGIHPSAVDQAEVTEAALAALAWAMADRIRSEAEESAGLAPAERPLAADVRDDWSSDGGADHDVRHAGQGD